MTCLFFRLQQASPNSGGTGVGEADSNTPANSGNTKNSTVSKNSSSGGSSPLHQLLQHNSSAFTSNVSQTVLSSSPNQHLQLESCGLSFNILMIYQISVLLFLSVFFQMQYLWLFHYELFHLQAIGAYLLFFLITYGYLAFTNCTLL